MLIDTVMGLIQKSIPATGTYSADRGKVYPSHYANYQMQLFDQNEKNVHLMFAMDNIKKRYGADKISRVNGIYSGGVEERGTSFLVKREERQKNLPPVIVTKAPVNKVIR